MALPSDPAIRSKIAKLLKLAGSPVDAKALGAVQMAERMLRGAGSSLCELADVLEGHQPEKRPRPARNSWSQWRQRVGAMLRQKSVRISPQGREFLRSVQKMGAPIPDEIRSNVEYAWSRYCVVRDRKRNSQKTGTHSK